MKRKRFTEEQIACCLRQYEAGAAVGAIIRNDGHFGADVLPMVEEVRRAGRG